MTIKPADILLYCGGAALSRYSPLSRRVARPNRRGEDLAETFTRSGAGGTWLDGAGVIHKAEANVPRVSLWDVWGGAVADDPIFLVELSRENLCLQSEDFSTSWTTSGASISANADTAPDGAATADRLVENSSAVAHVVYTTATVTVTDGAEIAFSVFVNASAGGRSWICLNVIDAVGGTDYFRCWFNVSTGAVGTGTSGATNGTFTRGIVETYGDSWYRCTIVGSLGSGDTTAAGYIYIDDQDNGDLIYQGDGSSYVSLWGAQIEDSAESASSYIPTAGSAVTRNNELCYFDLPLDAGAASFYLKFYEVMPDVASGVSVRLLHVGTNAASTDPRLVITKNSSQQYGFTHDNATTAYSTTQSAASETAGTVVELLAIIKDNGNLEFVQSLDEAAATTVENTNPYDIEQWAGQQVWLNGVNGSDAGILPLVAAVVCRGEQTLADFRELVA